MKTLALVVIIGVPAVMCLGVLAWGCVDLTVRWIARREERTPDPVTVAQDFAAEVDAAKVDEAVDLLLWDLEVSS